MGASWIDFLSIFIDFGVHLGTLLGGFVASWVSFLEALGSLGASWGLSWSFLGSFCTSWVDLGCFFVFFLYFLGFPLFFCGFSLWSSARSTVSRPAAYPSALHRVPPRSVPQRAPPCPAPQRSPECSPVFNFFSAFSSFVHDSLGFLQSFCIRNFSSQLIAARSHLLQSALSVSLARSGLQASPTAADP